MAARISVWTKTIKPFTRGGIQLVHLDSQTGKATGIPTTLATQQQIGPEASYIHFHDGWYYLFENEGFCCRGMNSTYRVMMGRSKTIVGPYLDKQAHNLARGGGSLFLGSSGEQIGPGHIGVLSEGNLDRFTFHYYNSRANGTPTLGLQTLIWDPDQHRSRRKRAARPEIVHELIEKIKAM